VDYQTPFKVGALPEAGLSDREIFKRQDLLDYALPVASAALAKGDITVMRGRL
jgi:hypothetical protein